MISMRSLRVMIGLLLLALILQTEACYYMQAARGHMDVMNKRRPVNEVIQDETTD